MKNFKKILATVLAVLFVLSVMVVSVSAASSDSAWYKKAVQYLDGLTISNIGSTGGEEVTRDEFVTWVAKIESHQLIESAWKKHEFEAMAAFDDVADSEHKGAIGYSIGREFITGDKAIGEAGNTFRPHDTLTFGEAAVVIVRLMAYEGKVIGETWEEQLYNYLFVANTYCGAFDATFLAKTAQYDPYHPLTKGEAAYILYTIMNGAAWADGDVDDEVLNLTSYGVDLGEYFANNNGATVKAQYVVANLPLVYSNTTQSFRRYDAYVTGATYASLFADKLFQTNGLLDTSDGKKVTLQNLANNAYLTIPASTFSTQIKKVAGATGDDKDMDALNFIDLGSVITLSATKANKAVLEGNTAQTTALDFSKVTKLEINTGATVDGYVAGKSAKLSDVKTGKAVTGWKYLGTKADADGAYTRLTATPVTWTNVTYSGGVPTGGNLVVGEETYTVVTSYTGKANEIKVYAPKDILKTTTKAIVSVVGYAGDTVYAGALFSADQKAILNLHRHVKVTQEYYKKTIEDNGAPKYTLVDIAKDFKATETYYVKSGKDYRVAELSDFALKINGYSVTKVDEVKLVGEGTDNEHTEPAFDSNKAYYLADGDFFRPATREDVTASFKKDTVYYIYDATNEKYVKNTADYSATTTYYLQDAATQETTEAGLSAFNVQLKVGTTYYTATKNPTYSNKYLSATTAPNKYYVENADKKLEPAELNAVLEKSWKSGATNVYYTEDAGVYTKVDVVATPAPNAQITYYIKDSGNVYEPVANTTIFNPAKNYYTAAEADVTGPVSVDKIAAGTYYIGTTTAGVLKAAKATDFTVTFTAATRYYTYDKATNTYPLVDQTGTEYNAETTYYIEKNGEVGDELVIAKLADFTVAFKAATTYYEVTKIDPLTAVYSNTPTDYYVDDATAGQIKKAAAADFIGRPVVAFAEGVKYYEKINGRFVRTTDESYDVTKTYYVDGTYNEFFYAKDDAATANVDERLKVEKTFKLEEDIPSWVAYELTTQGAFVTNTSFNIVSEFVNNGKFEQLINTGKALSAKEALQLILAPAQGECDVVFSDTDGDGAYDIAVVTESSRALYYGEVNSATDPAGEGYLGGNAAWTREVYDSFGNYITSVQGLKGHNIGGLVVDKTVGTGGASGGGTDGWNTTSTKASNKVQVVVCISNERQIYGGNNDTALYGVSNVYPYKTVDIADLTTGYIEWVASGTTKVDGVEVYTASVTTADGATTVYIPVNPAQNIVLPVTLDGVTSDVTFAAGKSLLSFVTDHVADKEIGTVQTGSWMAGHTVKYVVKDNGVAWCMIDTAENGAVTGYVTGVTKSSAGDNTYKVTIVASAANGTTSKTFAPTAQSIASVISYGYGSAMVPNSFGIDALFAKHGEMTVKAYKVKQALLDVPGKNDRGEQIALTNSNVFQGISGNAPLTGIYYDGEPDGIKMPTLVGTGYVTSSTFDKAGIIISTYDYITYVRPEYQNDTYFEAVEYDAHCLFGYIDWTQAGDKTASQTTKYIGASVKTLEVKGSATAVWIYDATTYALVNSVLVKGTLYNTKTVANDQIVSQKDLVYLSFTKDAGEYYTIDGLDDASYNVDVDTGSTDWGAIYMGNSKVFFTDGKLSSNYRTRASFGYRYPLLKTGAGTDGQWTNVGDFANEYILGYSKKADSKVDVQVSATDTTVCGYYELYDMVVGKNPYYKRSIDAKGVITYTLYFQTVEKLTNVKGSFNYQIDPSSTLLIALVNQATMKQEVDDGKSYTDSNKFYVDPSTKLVYTLYSKPVFDTTKTTTSTPIYDKTGATVDATATKTNYAASAIKEQFKLDKDIKEENLVSLSVAPYKEDEAGYVPGLYHIYLIDGLGSVKTYQMNQSSKISVIYPNSKTGNFEITVTNPKDLYSSKATVFVTDYQFAGSATTCTMLSVIGKLNKPVETPIDPGTTTPDTVTSGSRLTYLNSDATVIAEAIQLSNYWVIRSTSSAIDVTTGEEVGSIQFVFTTYKEDKITEAKEALRAGGYFLINKDNDVISIVKEDKADTFGTTTEYAKVLTGTITGVTADGKTTATINGVENTDISNKTFKFIYHDTEGKNFGIGGKSTTVSILTTSEIEATWETDAGIVAEGVGVAPHYFTKDDVATAVENVANAKASAITSYLNGTFWNVELSPLYNYFVSQRISYQTKGTVTLTFNYVVINDVYYVFVNSFTK